MLAVQVYVNAMNQGFLGQGLGGTSSYAVPAGAVPTPTQSNTSSTPLASGRKLIEKIFNRA